MSTTWVSLAVRKSEKHQTSRRCPWNTLATIPETRHQIQTSPSLCWILAEDQVWRTCNLGLQQSSVRSRRYQIRRHAVCDYLVFSTKMLCLVFLLCVFNKRVVFRRVVKPNHQCIPQALGVFVVVLHYDLFELVDACWLSQLLNRC